MNKFKVFNFMTGLLSNKLIFLNPPDSERDRTKLMKISIEGVSGCGKTTILRILEKMGYNCYMEGEHYKLKEGIANSLSSSDNYNSVSDSSSSGSSSVSSSGIVSSSVSSSGSGIVSNSGSGIVSS
ncbi:MAG: hypothetical protein WD512_17970, partial [Candidatus Paceibacterota bacterium]